MNAREQVATETVVGHLPHLLGRLSKRERLDAIARSVPIFETSPDGNQQTFRCPYCKCKHRHGAGNGHRSPHCHKENSPLLNGGYYLVSEVTAEDVSRLKKYEGGLLHTTPFELKQIVDMLQGLALQRAIEECTKAGGSYNISSETDASRFDRFFGDTFLDTPDFTDEYLTLVRFDAGLNVMPDDMDDGKIKIEEAGLYVELSNYFPYKGVMQQGGSGKIVYYGPLGSKNTPKFIDQPVFIDPE